MKVLEKRILEVANCKVAEQIVLDWIKENHVGKGILGTIHDDKVSRVSFIENAGFRHAIKCEFDRDGTLVEAIFEARGEVYQVDITSFGWGLVTKNKQSEFAIFNQNTCKFEDIQRDSILGKDLRKTRNTLASDCSEYESEAIYELDGLGTDGWFLTAFESDDFTNVDKFVDDDEDVILIAYKDTFNE